MYLFRIFHSFLPLRNPIGFGASDLLILALAILLCGLTLLKTWIEPYVLRVSQRTAWSMALLFALPVLFRVALLSQSPEPIPSGADDFSYLLLGDTLAHLRLSNTAHSLHQFFEAVFVLEQPAYASIYPLGQGIALAIGQLALRSPWAGVLLSSGVLCALCYWMLRAWVPPIWALMGGMLACIEFGPFCPWVNSYWGGTVSAIAGCLAFGALPRLCKSPNIRNGLMLGAGLSLQVLTRPFEAILLFIAAGVYLGLAFPWKLSSRSFMPLFGAFALVLAASGLTLLQNKAVTQSWTTLPYILSRYEYGVPTTFTFQPNPVPHRQLTPEQALDYRAQSSIHGDGTDSLSDYLRRLASRLRYVRFFVLPPLYAALLAFLPNLRRKRYIWVGATILLFALGTNFYPYFYPHYVAAVTCLFLLVCVAGIQKLPNRARLYVMLLSGTVFLFWFGIYSSGDDQLLAATGYQTWNYINRGDPQGRAAIANQLANSSGRQLVFVRYSTAHRFEEWIHNDAAIDSAQTVWANDLGTEENQKLLEYYPNRKAWLLEPDARPIALTPYSRDSGSFLTVH